MFLPNEVISKYEQYSLLGRFRRFLVESKIEVTPEDTDTIFKWFEENPISKK